MKLKNKNQRNISDSKRFHVKHFFAVGISGLDEKKLSNLSREQTDFQDILTLPIIDSYGNLTLKVLKSFEWLNEQFDYGLLFKYVLKCDDDSFVRLDNLIHEIQLIELLYLKSELSSVIEMSKVNSSPYLRTNVQINRNETKNKLSIYWGYFDGRANIKKSGKWKEQNWIVCDKYVPYALGGGYIVSKRLVTYIAKNVEYLRIYNSEDVSVGFWLSTVNNILRIHDVRFDTEWVSRGCQNFFLVSHNIAGKEMQAMFHSVMLKNELCSNEHITRNFYYYNWSAPPSQCCNMNKIKNIQ
ncbi:hypothetical protein HHI36_004671 [Cryptolaemus montrouzieri]|uniref:Hexosyltransferase n=1 Tax=Cryptolaemus montrouzieri TaxID=559131 RepID=A0ABD2NSH5_9CUCU